MRSESTTVEPEVSMLTPSNWEGSYAQRRAKEIGLTDEENHIADERFLLEPSYDGKGNLRINYVYPDSGAPITYQTDGSRYQRSVFRTRLRQPITNSGGKTAKYLAERGQPVFPYFGGIWRFFHDVKTIPVLVVTEGEIKSLTACKYGIPCVGLPGIHAGVRTTKNDLGKTVDAKFHPLLLEYIQEKKVGRIVLLHDCDATENKDQPKRAVSFWSAVRNAYFACRHVGLPLTYKVVSERAGAKGIDDILIAKTNSREVIREQLLNEESSTEFFASYPVASWDDLTGIRAVLGDQPSKSPVTFAEEFVYANYRIRHNAFTNENELDGQPMTDRDYNGIGLAATKSFYDTHGKTLARDIPATVIHSPSTISYNPVREFLQANCNRPSTSAISELTACIKTDTGLVGEGVFLPDYLQIFFRKWLINLVALALDNVNNPLLIALLGKQGTGKTEFFRRLLPSELRRYYAEQPISNDKDFLILLTKSLLVCDDELTGKSRAEQGVIKTVLSSQKYDLRAPYGRVAQSLPRRATLCGTGNDLKILADPTGNRRIIPINVLAIDHDQYNAIDKTDVLMEAYRAYRSGEAFRLTGAEVEQLNEATGEYEANNVEFELIADYLTVGGMPGKNNENMYSVTELIALLEPLTKQRLYPNHFGRALTKAGFTGRQCRKGGNPTFRYMVSPESRIFRNRAELHLANNTGVVGSP